MENAFNKFGEKAERVIGVVGLIGILIITANVVARFILRASMSWSDELLRTMFIYGYFIGAAISLISGGLMGLELLGASFDKHGNVRAKCILNIILNIINSVFFVVLGYYIFNGILLPFIVSGTSTSTSATPAWVLPLGYGIGVLIMLIVSIKNVIVFCAEACKKDVKS